MATQVVILAAGLGKRMHSQLPKMLHLLAGKPLLEHVVDTAAQVSASPPPIIIYGHQGERLRRSLSHLKVNWIQQKEQLGTGHALLQALSSIDDEHRVLVLCGDVPLITPASLTQLLETTPAAAIGLVTAYLPQPAGYGRIKRDSKKNIIAIIEEKDANPDELAIHEINTGIYLANAKWLKQVLPNLRNQNAQQEYYLTDIISIAVKEHRPLHAIQPTDVEEILGVNDRVQLAQLERFYQRRLAEKFMRQGVTVSDPARLDIRGEVQIGRDVYLDVNVILEGKVTIGDECVIGPHTILRDTILGNHVAVKAHSILEGAEIAAHCVIGPFARLRPGTILSAEVHIGNFVEVKNTHVGEKTKANHLTYLGDSEIGKQVNIGAGTITCNYDGVNKHKTIIGDHVFIGSDTQLVAPVTVHEGAVIGAGSTITKDTPPNQLTLTQRLQQRSVKNWKRPEKKSEKP